MSSRVFSFAILASALFIAGCNDDPELVCRQRLPLLKEKLVLAAASMESRRLKESRAPASESAASPGSVYAGELSESDRRGWMDWAVDRLHELQGTLDSLEGNSGPRDREIRTRVAQAANEVVVIYGAAETGDLRKITDALTALEENFEEAYDMLCMRKDPSFNGGASSSTL